jgi:hypothetical protein
MKNVTIFAILFLVISVSADAQTQTKPVKDTVDRKYSHVVTFSELDQRKIYRWGNGTRATATGREAGEHLPNYVKLTGDDSAIVVKGPKGDPWKYY